MKKIGYEEIVDTAPGYPLAIAIFANDKYYVYSRARSKVPAWNTNSPNGYPDHFKVYDYFGEKRGEFLQKKDADILTTYINMEYAKEILSQQQAESGETLQD